MEWVIYLTSYHPCLDHREDRSGDLLEDATDKVLRAWTPVQHISIDSRTNGATFKVLDEVSDDREPLHALEGLLDPQVQLAQVQVVCGIVTSVIDTLTVENGQQTIVFGKFSLDREAQTLRNLINLHVDRIAAISVDPVGYFFEKPSKLTELADKFEG